ncbi:hypothetical protein ACAX43_18285 [Paraburkholderia sp. IW21]|uniref:hypothetical protein n=1 Tax=Paraburkholderia sp. IW21 TaxID=3242488 RepID=UPI003521223C
MYSEPRKIVLTSLFVGAAAIATYVSQSDKNWLSVDEFGPERGDTSAHQMRGDTMTGSVSSGPVAAHSDSTAAVAGDLQAARNSLQRNDLVAAQAQLDAVRSVHEDDEQIRVLQREVRARTEKAQHALADTHAENTARQASKSTRSSSTSPVSSVRSHENHAAAREHSNHASRDAKSRRAPETFVAGVNTNASSGQTTGAGAPVVASEPSSTPAEPKVVANVNTVPAASPRTQQAAAPNSPAQTVPMPAAGQLAPPAGTLLKSDAGQKTRAQVRAEIARARDDGSLPPFGNPDPAGPGGAPSLTTAPRP